MTCNEARTAFAEIESLRTDFDQALEEAVRTGDREKAKALKIGLESRMQSLRETLVSPLERRLGLKEQYESQRRILEAAGILEALPSGEKGIKGIDGRAYPLPTYQEVRALMREKREVLGRKAEQGFGKLLLVPFGMKLDDLIARYKEAISRHYADMPDPADATRRIPDPRRTKLFGAKEKAADPDEPLELNTAEPVWVWDKYNGADESGGLVYGPQAFTADHKGKTKAEILARGSAWRITLLETDPVIPRETKGVPQGGRARLEANKTPNDYLALIGTGAYESEEGTTPEDWLMQAIASLEEKGEVLDDYQGKGSIAYNTGAYFPASDLVPLAFWLRDLQQAVLYRRDPAVRDGLIGARSAVRV